MMFGKQIPVGRRMRIITLDRDADPPDLCDIEPVLRRLASSPDRQTAARWMKLLELVHALHSDGPHPEAWGSLFGNELYLRPANQASRVTLRIRVDWQDFAPLRDGLPDMHYRFQIMRQGAKVSTDARARTPEEGEEIVRQALGWSR
jgi:hypothetical protein